MSCVFFAFWAGVGVVIAMDIFVLEIVGSAKVEIKFPEQQLGCDARDGMWYEKEGFEVSTRKIQGDFSPDFDGYAFFGPG